MPEHHANLWLAKMEKWFQEYEEDTLHTDEISRRFTCASKLSFPGVLTLGDDDFKTAINGLGKCFTDYPTSAGKHFAMRVMRKLRRRAFEFVAGDPSRWKDIVRCMLPCPEGVTKTIDPLNANFANSRLEGDAKMLLFRKELVELVFVELLNKGAEVCKVHLKMFCEAVFEEFESFFEDVAPRMMDAIGETTACARVMLWVMDETVVGDESMFVELASVIDAANDARLSGTIPISFIVGCAILEHEEFGPRVRTLRDSQKVMIFASPILQELTGELADTKEDELSAKHCDLLLGLL